MLPLFHRDENKVFTEIVCESYGMTASSLIVFIFTMKGESVASQKSLLGVVAVPSVVHFKNTNKLRIRKDILLSESPALSK